MKLPSSFWKAFCFLPRFLFSTKIKYAYIFGIFGRYFQFTQIISLDWIRLMTCVFLSLFFLFSWPKQHSSVAFDFVSWLKCLIFVQWWWQWQIKDIWLLEWKEFSFSKWLWETCSFIIQHRICFTDVKVNYYFNNSRVIQSSFSLKYHLDNS